MKRKKRKMKNKIKIQENWYINKNHKKERKDATDNAASVFVHCPLLRLK